MRENDAVIILARKKSQVHDILHKWLWDEHLDKRKTPIPDGWTR